MSLEIKLFPSKEKVETGSMEGKLQRTKEKKKPTNKSSNLIFFLFENWFRCDWLQSFRLLLFFFLRGFCRESNRVLEKLELKHSISTDGITIRIGMLPQLMEGNELCFVEIWKHSTKIG